MILFCAPQSYSYCFDLYVARVRSAEQETDNRKMQNLESGLIIPNVSDSGNLTLIVTTNLTLNTNTFYNATLVADMDMMEAGSVQFCKLNHITLYFLFAYCCLLFCFLGKIVAFCLLSKYHWCVQTF